MNKVILNPRGTKRQDNIYPTNNPLPESLGKNIKIKLEKVNASYSKIIKIDLTKSN